MTARQNYGVEGKKEEVKSVQVVLRQRTAWHPSIYLSLSIYFSRLQPYHTLRLAVARPATSTDHDHGRLPPAPPPPVLSPWKYDG